MPTSLLNFNILALLVSEIKRGSQNLMWGYYPLWRTLYAETFVRGPSTWLVQTACQISASYLYASKSTVAVYVQLCCRYGRLCCHTVYQQIANNVNSTASRGLLRCQCVRSQSDTVGFVDFQLSRPCWIQPGIILSVQSNQFVQSKMQFVQSKMRNCAV